MRTHVFTGTYEATLEPDGRTHIPRPFCTWLYGKATVFLSPNAGSRRLLLADNEIFLEKIEQYLAVFADRFARDDWSLFLHGSASDRDVDEDGRIELPKRLIELVGLESEILFVGCGDHVAIMPKETLIYPNLDWKSRPLLEGASDDGREG